MPDARDTGVHKGGVELGLTFRRKGESRKRSSRQLKAVGRGWDVRPLSVMTGPRGGTWRCRLYASKLHILILVITY